MERAEKLAAQGRHREAVAELTEWLKEHGPNDRAHSLLVSEQRKADAFCKPAGAFEYHPEPDQDPRTVLYDRWLKGEDVLTELIQAHLMVPKDKTVVPEIVRLVAKQPKSVRGLYILAVTLGDRADDYAMGEKFGQVFLKHWKKDDEVRSRMEKMMAFWKDRQPDTASMPWRLGHGDVQAMEEQILLQTTPWLQDMWAMHAAANGSQMGFCHLARRARDRGQTELEIRLARNLKDASEFMADELDYLVFTLHDLETAEKLAWNLNDDSQSDWLRLIHFEQGKTRDNEGIEALTEKYIRSLA
ncbi:hypothetical protein [uncultured Faecalibaculum sp.]|uniref:hypothetical protein n=1 Tax=uncultured Faecalibaculum sp. TaxID=1729681 RepID=UPI0026073BFA|nr:hypothetical protein [uncultured Faecalibaculum sp.]